MIYKSSSIKSNQYCNYNIFYRIYNKRSSILFEINRKSVITTKIWFNLTKCFRGHLIQWISNVIFRNMCKSYLGIEQTDPKELFLPKRKKRNEIFFFYQLKGNDQTLTKIWVNHGLMSIGQKWRLFNCCNQLIDVSWELNVQLNTQLNAKLSGSARHYSWCLMLISRD